MGVGFDIGIKCLEYVPALFANLKIQLGERSCSIKIGHTDHDAYPPGRCRPASIEIHALTDLHTRLFTSIVLAER
jgi:hypothetical protein